MKVEKRITEDDIRKAVMSSESDLLGGEVWDLVCRFQLQILKDQQAKDAEYEITQPKQLSQPK